MNKIIIFFCIVAAVFAIAALIYVVGSIIREVHNASGKDRPSKKRKKYYEEDPTSDKLLLLMGALGVTSILVTGCVLAKQHSDSNKVWKAPRKKR